MSPRAAASVGAFHFWRRAKDPRMSGPRASEPFGLVVELTARARTGPGGSERGLLNLPDVGCLKTLRAAGDFELHLVTLSEALEALRLDGAVVDEDVLTALLRDEPVTLCVVEPFDLSCRHTSNLSLKGVFRPLGAPAEAAGLPSGIGRQTKTPRELDPRGVCLDLSRSCTQLRLYQNRATASHAAPAKSIEFDGPGDRSRAVLGAEPARDRHREPARRPPGDDDVDLVRFRSEE